MDIKALALSGVKKVGPFVAILLLGVGLGWSLKPTQVRTETHETVVEKKVVDEQLVQQEVEKRVKEITANMEVKVVTVVVTKPDGTKVEKTTSDTTSKTTTTETKVVTVEKIVTVEKVVTRDVVVDKLVEPVLPRWHAGLLVGTAPRFDAPAQTPLLVGLEVEHRFIGPTFLGVWAMAGSPVSGAFKVTNAAVGVKLGLEF